MDNSTTANNPVNTKIHRIILTKHTILTLHCTQKNLTSVLLTFSLFLYLAVCANLMLIHTYYDVAKDPIEDHSTISYMIDEDYKIFRPYN